MAGKHDKNNVCLFRFNLKPESLLFKFTIQHNKNPCPSTHIFQTVAPAFWDF